MTERQPITTDQRTPPIADEGVPQAAKAGRPPSRQVKRRRPAAQDDEPWAEAFEFGRLVPVSQATVGSSRGMVVHARDVHVFLDPARNFPTWFRDHVAACSLSAGSDFVESSPMIENAQMGRPRRDYAITLHAAKKIAMVAKGRRGDAIREYFIEQERRLLAGEPPLVGHAATSIPVPALPENDSALIITPMEAARKIKPASARHRAMSAAMCHSLAEYLEWVGIRPINVPSAAKYFEDEVMYEAMLDRDGFGFARNELTGTWVFSRQVLDRWWDVRGVEILKANEYNNTYFACYRRGIEPPK